ncbi:MAG: barstar family protein [Anaerolinea sp.]|nr:barstar family protein [Anaerolinea sp.]
MAPIADLFNGQVKPGLYRLRADVTVESLQRQAEEHGWQLFHIDGAKTHDKRSFIRTAGQALDFPAYSAQNWDAFEESIRDLTWAPAQGYLVLFDEPDQFAASDPEQWAVAREILNTAVKFHRQQGAPMTVLFRRAGRALPDIPWL